MEGSTCRRQLARYLAPFTANVAGSDVASSNGAAPTGVLGLDNPVVDRFVTVQLRELMDKDEGLRERAVRLTQDIASEEREQETIRIETTLAWALRSRPHLVEVLWPLLAPSTMNGDVDPTEPARASGRLVSFTREQVPQFVRRFAAAMILSAVVAIVVTLTVSTDQHRFGALTVVEVFVIWILSFLPGWLYIRFIGQRAGALWDEFVLNLHRLGLDEPQHLPQPPVNSVYFRAWFYAGGATLSRHRNIYRQKFDAYYGRCVSEATKDSRVKPGMFFPVILATVAFAFGWTAIFWDARFFESAPETVLDMLGYGFLGAYLFNLQMLARRFFQSDLKPSAYASAVLRVIVVLTIVFVLYQLPLFDDGTRSQQAIVAFVVGLFPLVGLQALNRLVAVTLRTAVPTLQSSYPLSDLDGLNIWYEARLLEEGIEDMQNLVSANTVDVLLHTRVPVGRLVDWCDQAQLYLHLPPRKTGRRRRRRSATEDTSVHPREALAMFGVRSATAFLKAFAPTAVDDQGEAADPLVKRALGTIEERGKLPSSAVLTIAQILDDEPGLDPVRNWRAWETSTRPTSRPNTRSTITSFDKNRSAAGGDDDQVA
jgi:hypothetical protein